jgi:hypothetical protein
MTNFRITKKEAIDKLVSKAKELADEGDLAGAAACNAQIEVIRATNTTQHRNSDESVNINYES